MKTSLYSKKGRYIMYFYANGEAQSIFDVIRGKWIVSDDSLYFPDEIERIFDRL